MSNDGCKKNVSAPGRGVQVYQCGRTLKGDPEFPDLCGLHVSVIHRRRAKEKARVEATEQRKRDAETVKDRTETVNKALGIRALPEWTFPSSGPERLISRATGKVRVDLVELEALVAKIVKLRDLARQVRSQVEPPARAPSTAAVVTRDGYHSLDEVGLAQLFAESGG